MGDWRGGGRNGRNRNWQRGGGGHGFNGGGGRGDGGGNDDSGFNSGAYFSNGNGDGGSNNNRGRGRGGFRRGNSRGGGGGGYRGGNSFSRHNNNNSQNNYNNGSYSYDGHGDGVTEDGGGNNNNYKNNHNNNNNHNNRRFNQKGQQHYSRHQPPPTRTPLPPPLNLLAQCKKKNLSIRILTPAQQVNTFEEWVDCYFQDYHIRYDSEARKWVRTDAFTAESNGGRKQTAGDGDGDGDNGLAEDIALSGKLLAEYYEKYHADYDCWCQQRQDLVGVSNGGAIGSVSVPLGIEDKYPLFGPGLELGVGLGLGYHFINPLPPYFTEELGDSKEIGKGIGRSRNKSFAASAGGIVGEIDERGRFHPARSGGGNDGKGLIRYCYNKDNEIIGIDCDDDLILRTPYADRFSRSDTLSPGAANWPYWELGADGKAYAKYTSASNYDDNKDKKKSSKRTSTPNSSVPTTRTDLPQFWRDVARRKVKLPSLLSGARLSPNLFAEYRVPHFVYLRSGKRELIVPEEGATAFTSDEISRKIQFLRWAARYSDDGEAKGKAIRVSAQAHRFVLSPTSTISTYTAFSPRTPRTPLSPGARRQRQQGQQQQQNRHITVAAPVPVPVPVINQPINTPLDADTVRDYLGSYIGSLNRAGPPELPEADLEVILCQALQTIGRSIPPAPLPQQQSNANANAYAITYERLLSWYQPIADSVAQFKDYRSQVLCEQEVKQQKFERKVAKWRKRLCKETDSDNDEEIDGEGERVREVSGKRRRRNI